MPSYSIAFSTPHLSMNEILSRIWLHLQDIGIVPDESYTLLKVSSDRTGVDIVANKSNLRAPIQITEPSSSYNIASVPFWIDESEFILATREYPTWIHFGATFMGDIIRRLGQERVAALMLFFLTNLGLECSVLLREGREEEDLTERLSSGSSLFDYLTQRVKDTRLPPPMLTIIKSELVTNDILNDALIREMKSSYTLDGYVVFRSDSDE